MRTKFEVRIALPVPEITGQKIGQSLDTPTLHFYQKIFWASVRMDPVKCVNVPAKIGVYSRQCGRGFSPEFGVILEIQIQ